MRLVKGIGSVCIAAALVGFAGTSWAAPFIAWEMNPRLPDHVPNPGGTLTASCIVDPDNTTFESLVVRLTTPQGGVLQEWTITDALEFGFDWVVPESYPDGIYRYEMEYYSVEQGLTVALSEGYLVAGSTTGICVFKFEDLDGNGDFAGPESEPLLEGWDICWDDGPQQLNCQATSQDGVACWFFIAPGTYTLCEILENQLPNWSPTTGCDRIMQPVDRCCADVTVDSGTIAKLMFGNKFFPVPTEQKSWGQIKSEFK